MEAATGERKSSPKFDLAEDAFNELFMFLSPLFFSSTSFALSLFSRMQNRASLIGPRFISPLDQTAGYSFSLSSVLPGTENDIATLNFSRLVWRVLFFFNYRLRG